MLKPTLNPSSAAARTRWQDLQKRVHAGEFSSTTTNHGSIRNTLPSLGGIDADTFERMGPLVTNSETRAAPRMREVINTALEAREILGTSDAQVIPGFKEYLFPEEPAPLKSWANLKRSVLGERGIIAGLKEMFVDRRVGRGFAKILASTVFLPFQMVAVVVDTPRLMGSHMRLKNPNNCPRHCIRGHQAIVDDDARRRTSNLGRGYSIDHSSGSPASWDVCRRAGPELPPPLFSGSVILAKT